MPRCESRARWAGMASCHFDWSTSTAGAAGDTRPKRRKGLCQGVQLRVGTLRDPAALRVPVGAVVGRWS